MRVLNPLTEPKRIAFAGDWHENGDYAARAIKRAKGQGADVVVQLGDFGYSYSRRFLADVSSAALFQQIPILFVDGNHESFPKLHAYPIAENGLRDLGDGIWHLPRGFRWEWAGGSFLAIGGAHSVDRPYRTPGVSWWPEESITSRQAYDAAEPGPVDVLIAHDCPAGVVIPGIDDRIGPPPFPPAEIERSEEHRKLLRVLVDHVQPSVIWHGHYHVQYQAVADLGYGPIVVNGLDCDGKPLDRNVAVVDVADLLTRPQVGAA